MKRVELFVAYFFQDAITVLYILVQGTVWWRIGVYIWLALLCVDAHLFYTLSFILSCLFLSDLLFIWRLNLYFFKVDDINLIFLILWLKFLLYLGSHIMSEDYFRTRKCVVIVYSQILSKKIGNCEVALSSKLMKMFNIFNIFFNFGLSSQSKFLISCHHLFEQIYLIIDKKWALRCLCVKFLYVLSLLGIMIYQDLNSFSQIISFYFFNLIHYLFIQHPSETFFVDMIHRFHIDQFE